MLSLGVFHIRGDLACMVGFVGTIILSIVGFGVSFVHSITDGLGGVMN